MLERLLEDRCVSTTQRNCWKDSSVKGLTLLLTIGTLTREPMVRVHMVAMVWDLRDFSRGCSTDITSEMFASILASFRDANRNPSYSMSWRPSYYIVNNCCDQRVCQLTSTHYSVRITVKMWSLSYCNFDHIIIWLILYCVYVECADVTSLSETDICCMEIYADLVHGIWMIWRTTH